jgi:hypothetical protein
VTEADAIAEALGATVTRYPGRSTHFVQVYDAVQEYLWHTLGTTVPLSAVKRVCRLAGIRVARPAPDVPQEAQDVVLTADLSTVRALDGTVPGVTA